MSHLRLATAHCNRCVASVQLRPTVRLRAKALDYDVSLLERLYTGPAREGMSRVMLDVR